MAKGKHAPAPGAVRKDKVIHPNSRKAAKLQSKIQKRSRINNQVRSGGLKLQALGEKLNWFKENLAVCMDAVGVDQVNLQVMKSLAEAFLSRFEEEIEQITLKNSIGGKNKRSNRHRSRLDVIQHTIKAEQEEYEGCGLEMPDLLDKENFENFQKWEGELRFVQNIKVKRFRKKDLEMETSNDITMDTN